MNDRLLRTVYHFLFDPSDGRRPSRCRYSDAIIVLIQFFRVMHHLSERQAMDRSRWPLWTRRLPFPSRSQFNRRVKWPQTQALISEVNDHFRERLPRGLDKSMDGKPLVVGGYSKDADAKRGHVPGGWARGYKVHAMVDAGGAIDVYEVTSLNAGEATVARSLLPRADLRGACVRADANYDSVALYALAETQGGRLIAPRRKTGTGLGHHPQHPHRLDALAELEQRPGGRRVHNRHRLRIEQIFGHLTNVTFGLWALPPSVRRLPRVRRWVTSTIALYHVYVSEIAVRRTTAAA
jgi:hypothetical protein